MLPCDVWAQVELRGQAVTVLKKGSYFGEIGVLRSARRSACVRALSDTCDLFVLTKVRNTSLAR